MQARTFAPVKITAKLSTVGGALLLSIKDPKSGVAVYGVKIHPRSIRLFKIDGATIDVAKSDAESVLCTCEDASYRDREGGCRHVVACRQTGLIR
jgi:hypothetical protein